MSTQAQGPSFGIDSSVPDFNSETYRMLRDDWSTAGITTFSQEVWALFQLLQDYNTNGSQTFNQSSPTAPITINQPFSLPNSPAITINRLGPNGDIQGQLEINSGGITIDGDQFTGAGGPSTFPGTVVSQVSGSIYKVSITTAAGPLVVNATQIQIDPAAVINNGTGVMVSLVGSTYYMQVPVWN